MIEESVNPRLTETSEPLAEVEILADGGVRVVVGALHGCLGTEDVADQGGVADFLVCHKFDQESIGCSQSGGLKVGDGEAGETIMEEVQLDPLLVENQSLKRRSASSHQCWKRRCSQVTRNRNRFERYRSVPSRLYPTHRPGCMGLVPGHGADRHSGMWSRWDSVARRGSRLPTRSSREHRWWWENHCTGRARSRQ